MKKFLSLVLAMIMALSLVTISAGAVEYKDITDLDEIMYDEAVAVLNKIGVITGYENGSFGPKSLLTRQAAAKIIVGLLIGPEAAQNLTAAVAPYPDVPTSSQFAGYISYCKTANIINGYTDGTFKPGDSLTGYAFAKMLLGALGYRGDVEGFTGSGWTMNVAKTGSAANLFDRLSFRGGEAVDRETACQLALNTLKATMVEYSVGFNITAGDAAVTGAMTRSYVTSNQEYAKYISNRKMNTNGSNTASDSHFTVEFGEEHFKDLRLNDEHSYGTEGAYDGFGRPANHWSWKKVTIGVFPIPADYSYTEQMATIDSNPSDAAKVRALGLNGYKVDEDTILTVNGMDIDNPFPDNKVGDIANWTDNGVVVEVYVSEDDADMIANVVVVYTQLMQIKKVGSESVTLKGYEDKTGSGKTEGDGYNKDPFDKTATVSKLNAVDVNNGCFEFLSGKKADDIVAIIPVAEDTDGSSFSVYAAYEPKTVTGALTGSTVYAGKGVAADKRSTIGVTVGGTTYKVANWNYDLKTISQNVLKTTKKDVTLYLDEFGNAMLAKGVGSTNDFMILGAWRNQVVNGTVVRIAEGWDIKGSVVSLNVGAEKSRKVENEYSAYNPGDVLYYTNDGATGNAQWVINKTGVFFVPGNERAQTYAIRSGDPSIALVDKGNILNTLFKSNQPMVSSTVKTIYVEIDPETSEVEHIEFKDGLQNITKEELQENAEASCNRAEATMSVSDGKVVNDSNVTAVVIKTESRDANVNNLGYVYDFVATDQEDENGDVIIEYNVLTKDGDGVLMKSTNNIGKRKFVRFTELENGLYRLVNFGTRPGSSVSSNEDQWIYRLAEQYQGDGYTYILDGTVSYSDYGVTKLAKVTQEEFDKHVPRIFTTEKSNGVSLTSGDNYLGLISVYGAKIMDLRNKPATEVSTAKELKALVQGTTGSYGNKVKVDIAYNDNPDSDSFRRAYYVIIQDYEANKENPYGPTEQTDGVTGYVVLDDGMDIETFGAISGERIYPLADNTLAVDFTISKPDFVKFTQDPGAGSRLVIDGELYVDGKYACDVVGIEDKGSTTVADLGMYPSSTTTFKSFSTKKFVLGTFGQGGLPTTGSTFKFVLTSVSWGEVEVKFVDENGKDVQMTGTANTDYTTTLMTAKGTNADIKASISDAVYSDSVGVEFTMENVVEETSGHTSHTTGTVDLDAESGSTGGTEIRVDSSDKYRASGLGPVIVTLKGLKEADKPTYNLFGLAQQAGRDFIKTSASYFVDDINGDITDNTPISLEPYGKDRKSEARISGTDFIDMAAGEEIGFEFHVGVDATGGLVDHYEVEIPIVDKNGEEVVTLFTDEAYAGEDAVFDQTLTVGTQNYYIDGDNVTITPVYKVLIKKAEFDKKERAVVIILDGKLDLAESSLGGVFSVVLANDNSSDMTFNTNAPKYKNASQNVILVSFGSAESGWTDARDKITVQVEVAAPAITTDKKKSTLMVGNNGTITMTGSSADDGDSTFAWDQTPLVPAG